MPGPSFAPIFAAVGTFLLFFGLVFGGPSIILGLIALLLTLLYWGREALTEFDHVAGTHPQLPAVIHGEPPPGVHIPGPSFRPLLASLAVAILFAGLVFGGWLLGVGVLVTILTLLGWLSDARKEYRHVVDADRTGHIVNEPAPGWPKVMLSRHGRPGRRLGRPQPRLVPAEVRQRRRRGRSVARCHRDRRPPAPARSRSSRNR